MVEGLRILAIVPARGGSKGVPMKNIKPVNGLPLLAYTAKLISEIAEIDRAVVSTDSRAIADVAERCRNRTIAREELVGGTFTVSSVGMYGGMFTTPIINYPEVAILGVGEAKDRVLVRDGSFYAGKLMSLSLSCDHRVVDGAEGARFLRTLAGLLEQPDALVQ